MARPSTITIAGEVFNILQRYHNNRWYLCANIKAHAVYDVKLDKRRERKIAVLEGRDYEHRENLEEHAWRYAQEFFWSWADAEARAHNLGKVFSDGRQGGWMLLKKFDDEHLERIKTQTERECDYCSKPFDDHLDGKCLFLAADFKPHWTADLDELRQALTLLSASRSVVDDDCPSEYLFQLEHEVDDMWDAYRADRVNHLESQKIHDRTTPSFTDDDADDESDEDDADGESLEAIA